jgi:hypothetical protein
MVGMDGLSTAFAGVAGVMSLTRGDTMKDHPSRGRQDVGDHFDVRWATIEWSKVIDGASLGRRAKVSA